MHVYRFTVNSKTYSFNRRSRYLECTTDANDVLFDILGIDTQETARHCYGYWPGEGMWPQYDTNDYQALDRLVRHLRNLLDDKKPVIRIGAKVTVGHWIVTPFYKTDMNLKGRQLTIKSYSYNGEAGTYTLVTEEGPKILDTETLEYYNNPTGTILGTPEENPCTEILKNPTRNFAFIVGWNPLNFEMYMDLISQYEELATTWANGYAFGHLNGTPKYWGDIDPIVGDVHIFIDISHLKDFLNKNYKSKEKKNEVQNTEDTKRREIRGRKIAVFNRGQSVTTGSRPQGHRTCYSRRRTIFNHNEISGHIRFREDSV